ncbi:MAG: ABC transporter ATP-binding protein [Candidatus Lokiarchaeota archaeon]|nr:ABC transporter ATP-binding protein [Candidatus Lokiarchaeota archaeon]
MTEPYIEFDRISKTYKDLLALDNISFKIQKGEIFGYIGPNGAGKTTTIKILVGLIQEFEGNVTIFGKNISPKRKDLYNKIGYHPQDAGFQEWRTIDHAYKTYGRLSGLTSDHLENRIQEVLELVGLSDKRFKKIIHLSGGMFQKLRLGQALLHNPEILVLDEPLSGLDPASRYQFKKVIKTLAKKGITILFSSHILNDVQDIADKIGILNEGKIMQLGTPEELQDSFQVGNVIEILVAKNSVLCKNLEQLEDIDYVENSKENKQLIYLKPESDIDLIIPQILGKLNEQKCKIRSFRLVKPSLEDVYLNYVRGKIE